MLIGQRWVVLGKEMKLAGMVHKFAHAALGRLFLFLSRGSGYQNAGLPGTRLVTLLKMPCCFDLIVDHPF